VASVSGGKEEEKEGEEEGREGKRRRSRRETREWRMQRSMARAKDTPGGSKVKGRGRRDGRKLRYAFPIPFYFITSRRKRFRPLPGMKAIAASTAEAPRGSHS